MKNIYLRIFVIILFVSVTDLSGQTKDQFEFETNKEAHDYFMKLYNAGSYTDAAIVLRKSYKKFANNIEANAFNLAITLGHLGELDEGLEVLNYGHLHGVWYNVLALGVDVFNPYKDLPAFKEFVARNLAMKNEACLQSKAQYMVKFPSDYAKDKSYPLFIGLHGAGGNLKQFPTFWTSERVQREFISVYIQSSQMVSRKGFTWSDDMDLSIKEVDSIFMLIKDSLSFSENEVIIGGFSSGGIAAMELALRNTFPVAGFISLCPDKPEAFTEENIVKAKDRDLTGVILTTELDPRVDVQQEMRDELTRLGVFNRFVVTPNTGHWIPDDLGELIDQVLDLILKKR